MTKALDYFDPSREYGQSLTKAMAQTQCRFLVVSFTTDWRFAPERSQEIVDALITNHKPVTYLDVDAEQGHDSFLFPIPLYVKTLRAFLGGEAHLKSTHQVEIN